MSDVIRSLTLDLSLLKLQAEKAVLSLAMQKNMRDVARAAILAHKLKNLSSDFNSKCGDEDNVN
ncbi:MAG TPA: hypothetical protein VFE58_13165 [Tepidisphaeraceae bacterium]|jgi:hypothetical protein|nr:hypothetical protein [Tepidisphaeraceae bacterium]